MMLKVLYIVSANLILVTSSIPTQTCGPNEEWLEDTNLCPPTCEFQHPPCYTSSLVAQPGCECRSGYLLLNDIENKCVKAADCPKKCRKPLFQWNDCGTRCPSTCAQPGPRPCVKVCERGCFCPKGYLLDDYKMECVKKEECA